MKIGRQEKRNEFNVAALAALGSVIDVYTPSCARVRARTHERSYTPIMYFAAASAAALKTQAFSRSTSKGEKNMNAQPEIVRTTSLERGSDHARRLFDQAGRDYESRRQARQKAESAYHLARAKLIDDLRVEAAELVHRSKEALRRIDAEHAERMAQEDRIIAALDALRQA